MRKGDFILKEDSYGDEIILSAYIGNDKVVRIPDEITKIDKNAFADKSHHNETLETIILPSSVLEIEDSAFSYCTNLKEIQFNEELESIGLDIVEGCTSLKKIEFPPRISTIFSFEIPNPDMEIILNDNLVHVAFDAFKDSNKGINSTNKILLKNANYQIIDGFMVNTKFMASMFRVDMSKSECKIPYGVKVIGSYTFDELQLGTTDLTGIGIEKVIFPVTVKKIEFSAFSNCDDLKQVIYEGNSSDIEIDDEAFSDCKKFTEHEILVECADSKIASSQKSRKITHLMLERFKIIHKKIRSESYPNTEQLRLACRDELGLDNQQPSIATISRDLEYLRNSMDAPIEYDRGRNGYYYSQDFELRL